jgi:hypothetical protein
MRIITACSGVVNRKLGGNHPRSDRSNKALMLAAKITIFQTPGLETSSFIFILRRLHKYGDFF